MLSNVVLFSVNVINAKINLSFVDGLYMFKHVHTNNLWPYEGGIRLAFIREMKSINSSMPSSPLPSASNFLKIFGKSSAETPQVFLRLSGKTIKESTTTGLIYGNYS